MDRARPRSTRRAGPDPAASVAGWADRGEPSGDAAGEGEPGPLAPDRDGHDERDDAQQRPGHRGRRRPLAPVPWEVEAGEVHRARRSLARPWLRGPPSRRRSRRPGRRRGRWHRVRSRSRSSASPTRVTVPTTFTMSSGSTSASDSSASPVTTIVPTAVPSSSVKPSAVRSMTTPPTRTMRPS